MASKVEVDELAGAGSAGVMTVVGEGGSTTTSLQQGLCKCWVHMDGSGTPSADDSFNLTSITDTASGRYTLNIANDFGNGNYACSFMAGNDGTTTVGRSSTIDGTPASGAFAVRLVSVESDGNIVTEDVNILYNFHGDLA